MERKQSSQLLNHLQTFDKHHLAYDLICTYFLQPSLQCDSVVQLHMSVEPHYVLYVSGLINSPSSTWWRHQMETFSALLALWAGNSPVTVDKGQWRGALMFYLICAWINGWVNNLGAGDLRRHRGQYDVIVMIYDVVAVGEFYLPLSLCYRNLKRLTIS